MSAPKEILELVERFDRTIVDISILTMAQKGRKILV